MSTIPFSLCLLAAALPRQAVAPADPLAALEHVDWSGWQDLPGLLADVHARTGVPALAAAYVRGGRVVASATVGVRAEGSDVALDTSAAFHLGSVTKSFTAVVVGKLVEDGVLTWDARVGDVLGDVPMHAAYRDVTLDRLLRHTGGLHAYTQERPEGAPDAAAAAATGPDARAAFVAAALGVPPAAGSDGAPVYSNAGYALAGHLAELAAGSSWEELVRRIVFEPLGMRSAGFGVPAYSSGHVLREGRFVPVPLDGYPPLEGIAPAGNVHASADDLARYLIAHLDGLAGRDGILRAETVRRLHADATGTGFAAGWQVRTERSGEPVHSHGGTVGASYAEVRLHPARESGALVLVAIEQRLGEALANRVMRALDVRYGAPSAGFVAADRPSPRVTVVERAPAGAEDATQKRVVDALARALNDEDRAAWRALFAASYDREDADSMFDFMARNVLPVRGAIRSFHELSTLRIEGDERVRHLTTFHLENGTPGYFGVVLDDAQRLVELSLFVKPDLCPNGVDPACALVVRRLGDRGERR